MQQIIVGRAFHGQAKGTRREPAMRGQQDCSDRGGPGGGCELWQEHQHYFPVSGGRVRLLSTASVRPSAE